MDKKTLSERDICTKYITPALAKAGWDVQTQIREEVTFTKGRIIVRGRMVKRGTPKRADYILEYKPNLRLAVIEVKDNNHTVSDGMQQGLEYAQTLDVPFVYSSNGDGFLEHDRTRKTGQVEREIPLSAFPTPGELWSRYTKAKGITGSSEKIITQDYYVDASGKAPHYFQEVAINRTIEAIAKGQNRILLAMATGTGKTYTAFQIIWRLWKSRTKKRILFLADRNILVDQSRNNDFKPFGSAMTKIVNRTVDKSYEIYLSLYQAVTGTDEKDDTYKQFSPDFFDLIIIDECHRGSAAEDATWRRILEYFSSATQVGLTATPKETRYVSNIDYFGPPVYTYSLKQGIDDGFLAPYKVIRIDLDKDLEGWRPERGKLDKNGQLIGDRIYNLKDFDRTLVLEKRTQLVAKRVSDFLKATDRFDKSIVFCEDIDHAERMREALVNENPDLAAENPRYVMRITGDNQEGKDELDNFILPESRYPVIATTSKLMTTGVDAQTCKLIVIDQNIESLSLFKQIIGRGTRVKEEYKKWFFTIIDFRKATELFADPLFDGDPVQVYIPRGNDPPVPPDDEPPGEHPPGEGRGDDVIVVDPPLGKRVKYYVQDVPVTVVSERVQYYDKDGRLVSESLKDYTKKNVLKEYSSLNQFLNVWTKAEQKRAVIWELETQGVFFEALREEVSKDLDAFDLVCHVAFGQPPLTRRERANNVRKRNYFAKYGEKARAILDALLDKYADEGIENIEDMEVLKVQPLNRLGTPVEIVESFGGRQHFLEALKELEGFLYAAA